MLTVPSILPESPDLKVAAVVTVVAAAPTLLDFLGPCPVNMSLITLKCSGDNGMGMAFHLSGSHAEQHEIGCP